MNTIMALVSFIMTFIIAATAAILNFMTNKSSYMNAQLKQLGYLLFLQFLFYPLLFTAYAQNKSEPKKFYVGLDAGVGLLKLSRNTISFERKSRFALGFYGGYKPARWLRTGLYLSGWLIEPYGNFYADPSKGISISNTYGQIQVFPFKNTTLFVNAAGGFTNYINHHPDKFNAKGHGALLGVGYEKELKNNFGISVLVNYGFGQFRNAENVVVSITNQQYDVVEFLIGFTFR